jgi:hypothetical protein
MDELIIVDRTADISKEDALLGLATKFPGYEVSSFKTIKRREASTGEETLHYQAALKLSENPFSGGSSDESSEPEAESPVDDPAGEEAEVSEPESHATSEMDLLHEILTTLKSLVKKDEGVHKKLEGGGPVPVPGGSTLPPPVKPQGMPGGMKIAPMAAKRSFQLKCENSSDVTLKKAVRELNETYQPVNFKVAKINRAKQQDEIPGVKPGDIYVTMTKG